MKKKLLSYLLIICMVVTMMPVSTLNVSAAEGQIDRFVQHAIDHLGDRYNTFDDNEAFGGNWCVLFVGHCASKTGLKSIMSTGTDTPDKFAYETVDKKGGRIIFVDKSFYNAKRNNFKNKQRVEMNEDYQPRKGDLIIFSSDRYKWWTHIGIVRADCKYAKKNVLTIEGNTGSDYYTSSTVAKRTRTSPIAGPGYIVAYVKPKYSDSICTTHVADTKSGDCKNCGAAYITWDEEQKLLDTSYASSDKKFYTMTAKANLRKYPETGSVKKAVAKGDGVRVLGKVKNKNWYKAQDVTGMTGYISADLVKTHTVSASDRSDLRINLKATDGKQIKKGSKVYVTGSVSSDYPLKKVRITISYNGSAMKTKSQEFGSYIRRSAYLGNTWEFVRALNLGDLACGTYSIRVAATDVTRKNAAVSETATVTVYNPAVDSPKIEEIPETGGKNVRISNSAGGTLYYTVNGKAGSTTTSSKKFTLQEGVTKFKAYVVNQKGRSPNVYRDASLSKLAAPGIKIEQKGRRGNITISAANRADTVMYRKGESGGYSIYDGRPVAVGNGDTVYAYSTRKGFVKSDVVSETAEFAEPEAPEIKLLNEEADIAVGGIATVAWEKDRKAQSYKAVLCRDGNVVKEIETEEPQVAFALEEAGEYTVEVTASNEIGESEASNVLTVRGRKPLKVIFAKEAEGDSEQTEILAELEVPYGSTAGVQEVPQKKGYEFAGWKNLATGTISVNEYQNAKVKEDTTYVAAYTAKTYKVRFFSSSGQYLETRSFRYGEPVNTEDVNVPDVGAGETLQWYVIKTSDGNSRADISFVDSDMDVQAVSRWDNPELPVKTLGISTTQNGTGLRVKADITTDASKEKELDFYLIVALKGRTPDGTEKTIYADRIAARINKEENAGSYIFDVTPNDISMNKIESPWIEVIAVESRADGSTGSTYSEAARCNVTIEKQYTEGPWSLEKPEKKDGREIESKVQYFYRNRLYKYGTEQPSGGYSAAGTEYYNFTSGKWQKSASSAYGIWKCDKPEASTDTSRKDYTTKIEVENKQGVYKTYAYYCDCKRVCWKNSTGSCGYCGSKTRNSMTMYSQKDPCSVYSKDKTANDGSYILPKTIGESSPGKLGTVYCMYYKGSRTTSFTTAAKGGHIYVWPSATPQKTIYRTKKTRTRTVYSKWGEWSEGSDTPVSGDETKKQTLYRYMDVTEEEVAKEDLKGETRQFTGIIDGEDLSEKTATVMVYQMNNTDPNRYQMQYIGQTVIGEGNSYSFSFVPRNEPTLETGKYIVALSIEGTKGLINVGTVGKEIKYTVRLHYTDENGEEKIAEQTVEENGDADLSGIEIPQREGYIFTGWSKRTNNITSDMATGRDSEENPVVDIEAQYMPVRNTVVFVDWINESIHIEHEMTGEKINAPERPDETPGYRFIGWKLEDGTMVEANTLIDVTGDMIISAEFEQAEYVVRFMGTDGNAVDSQTVKYGESAEPPAYTPSSGFFVGWSTETEWWNVTDDTDVYPVMIYDESALKPESDIVTEEDAEGKEKRVLRLSTREEGAEIYYTTDGTSPDAEKIMKYLNTENKSDYIGSISAYEKELVFNEDSEIKAVSYVEGKNLSEENVIYYEPQLTEDDSEAIYTPGEEWKEIGTYEVRAKAGKEITLSVDLDENPGLSGYDLLVTCDRDVFYTDRDEYDSPAYIPGTVSEDGTGAAMDSEDGYRIVWNSDSGSETGGNMFTMTMHVNDDAETGTYKVGVYYMPENTVNGYYDEVSLDNARVSIESSASIRLDTLEINLGRSSWAYEGTEIKPSVVIEGLKEGEDYTVSYENNVNAGTAKAVIAGKGDYTGTVEKEFTITPVSIANAEIEEVADQICREDVAEPEIKAMFKGRQLKQGEDYTVSYENNGSEGTATAVIKGTGNFSGTEKRSFRIISADQRKDADVTGSIYLKGAEESPVIRLYPAGTEKSLIREDIRKNAGTVEGSIEIETGELTESGDGYAAAYGFTADRGDWIIAAYARGYGLHIEDMILGGDRSLDIRMYLLGDVNGDGKVSIGDRTMLTRYLANWSGYEEAVRKEVADINGDGRIGIADVTILRRHLAGWKGYENLR